VIMLLAEAGFGSRAMTIGNHCVFQPEALG
jgi:hypothetical protein